VSTPSEGSPKSPPKGRRIAEKPAKERRRFRGRQAARQPNEIAARLAAEWSARHPGEPTPATEPASERVPERATELTPAPAAGSTAEPVPEPTAERTPDPGRRRRAIVAGALLLLVAGLAALGSAIAGLGPSWIDGAGAIAIVTVLSGALAHRTGGRPLIATCLALAIGLAAVVIGGAILQTGAAVLTVVVGGVYAVMATVPAISFLRAAREVLFSTLIAVLAALAAVGFEPSVTQPHFDYTSILLSLALVFGIVYRLGAGIHGLGRRGLIAVLVGVVVLVLTLVYAELLRLYGASSVVGSVLDFTRWTTELIGAFPRPLVVLLGIPALLWGCFQRARRRQGWWVCAFGVTATVPLAQGLLDPDGSFLEAGLRAAYSLLLGLLLGYLLVRLDLALTAPRGRRGRRAEEAEAHRPEPSRFAEL
jgi:hypothetical protein